MLVIILFVEILKSADRLVIYAAWSRQADISPICSEDFQQIVFLVLADENRFDLDFARFLFRVCSESSDE